MKRCAIILSHGRSDSCITINTLRNAGYTGEIVILLDDEDPTDGKYRDNYPDCKVLTFCKKEEMKRPFSAVDNFGIRGTVLYARNAAWEIMKREGYDEFLMLDDDYTEFEYKWIVGETLKRLTIRSADEVFDVYFRFLEESDADVVCMAQGGDFIGGGASTSVKKWFWRKAMNVYFFRTDRPYYFTGAMNDDVNTYVLANIRGKKVFTVLSASIVQRTTQKADGGLTQMYLDFGTYNKSFYSVIVAPSCVRISRLGDCSRGKAYWRIHHNIQWRFCSPKIISEQYRK